MAFPGLIKFQPWFRTKLSRLDWSWHESGKHNIPAAEPHSTSRSWKFRGDLDGSWTTMDLDGDADESYTAYLPALEKKPTTSSVNPEVLKDGAAVPCPCRSHSLNFYGSCVSARCLSRFQTAVYVYQVVDTCHRVLRMFPWTMKSKNKISAWWEAVC